MRMVKKFASVVFSLIIILAIGGYVAVRNFDLNKYKSYATELVERELGRKLTIAGDASLGISLVPTIIINDVQLSNPSWAQFENMLSVEQIEVKFAILPLLHKQIVIDKINLIRPEIYLERSAQGENSWNFSSAGASSSASAAAPAQTAAVGDNLQNTLTVQKSVEANPAAAMLAGFAAKSVTIENGLVQYYDATNQAQSILQINNIAMQAPSANEDMNADFDVVYNQEEIKGSLHLGSLNMLLANQEPYPFDLTTTVLGIDAELSGSVVDLMNEPRYAFEANLYNPAGNQNAPETTLQALVNGDTQKAEAEIKVLNIVNNLITGTVSATWSTNVPQIGAVLKSDVLNLQNFRSESNFALNMPSFVAEAQALEYVPDKAIPYALMKQVNANVDLSVGKLQINPQMQMENVSVKADLKNGLLKISPLKAQLGGGSLQADAEVNASRQTVNLKAVGQNIIVQNVYSGLLAQGDNFGIEKGGRFDFDINLSGQGATYRQLVNSFNGSVIGIGGESTVQTGKLQFMAGNFISQLLSALNIDRSKYKNVDLTCAVVRADITNGKARFPKGIVFNAKQLSLVADGTLDLNNDKIDFAVRPFSGKLVDTNVAQALASFVKIEGTLQDPKVRINDKEALKALVGVAASGGTTYLGSKLLLDADNSPCYTALIGTPYASRFPKPTGVSADTQAVYNGAEKAVDKSLNDLKDAANGLLDSVKAFGKRK